MRAAEAVCVLHQCLKYNVHFLVLIFIQMVFVCCYFRTLRTSFFWGRKLSPQLDAHSCGVFVCMFAKLLSAGVDDNKVIEEAFDEEKIKNFRILMAEEILSRGKLFTRLSNE